MWLLRVLNITLAFNDTEKGNKMWMVVSQIKQSFMHKDNFSKTVFMNSPLLRVYINSPSPAFGQIWENGLFSKERVKRCPLGPRVCTCTPAPMQMCRVPAASSSRRQFYDRHVMDVSLWPRGLTLGVARWNERLCSWLRRLLSIAYIACFNYDFMSVAGPALSLLSWAK